MEFRDLIAQLRNDSKSYHFCRDGLKGVASAASVLQCVAMLRENIVYCFDSDYHQAVADNIEEWYKNWKEEFNKCGIWVNEDSENKDAIIIITTLGALKPTEDGYVPYLSGMVTGKQRCFLFGEKGTRLLACNHARVYSKNPNAELILTDHTHGFVKGSYVEVTENASCYAEDAKVILGGSARAFLASSCTFTVSSVGAKIESIEHLGFQ